MKCRISLSERQLTRAFGCDEYGAVMLPHTYSSRRIARLLQGDPAGCTRCFPHGFENSNDRAKKVQRSWKSHRRYQYRVNLEINVRAL